MVFWGLVVLLTACLFFFGLLWGLAVAAGVIVVGGALLAVVVGRAKVKEAERLEARKTAAKPA